MSCNTCTPKRVIQACPPVRQKPVKQCEPVCADYQTVRNLVINWLYDLDSSVGFGKTLSDYIRRAVGTSTANDPVILESIKQATIDALVATTTNTVLQAVNAKMQTKSDEIMGSLQKLAETELRAFKSRLDTAIANAQTTTDGLESLVTSSIDRIRNSSNALLDSITLQLNTEAKVARSTVLGLIDNLENTGRTIKSDIVGSGEVLRNTLNDTIRNGTQDIELIISQAKQDIDVKLQSLTNVNNQVQEALNELRQLQRELVTFRSVFGESVLRAHNP